MCGCWSPRRCSRPSGAIRTPLRRVVGLRFGSRPLEHRAEPDRHEHPLAHMEDGVGREVIEHLESGHGRVEVLRDRPQVAWHRAATWLRGGPCPAESGCWGRARPAPPRPASRAGRRPTRIPRGAGEPGDPTTVDFVSAAHTHSIGSGTTTPAAYVIDRHWMDSVTGSCGLRDSGSRAQQPRIAPEYPGRSGKRNGLASCLRDEPGTDRLA